MNKRILVTGSGGLVGYETSKYFLEMGYEVHGIDNNSRESFFGKGGDVRDNIQKLESSFKNYKHFSYDITNALALEAIFVGKDFELVVHCASQPSHDFPFKNIENDGIGIDFRINVIGTFNSFSSRSR